MPHTTAEAITSNNMYQCESKETVQAIQIYKISIAVELTPTDRRNNVC